MTNIQFEGEIVGLPGECYQKGPSLFFKIVSHLSLLFFVMGTAILDEDPRLRFLRVRGSKI